MSFIPSLSLSTLTWNSIFCLNVKHPSDHSHLCSLKCHLIFFLQAMSHFHAFCLLFLYSYHSSVKFSFFQFPYFIFFSLTASATSSFHHHVSLCLQGPFDNPHMICAVSIIIFFIYCQCSFTSKYFHSVPLPLPSVL